MCGINGFLGFRDQHTGLHTVREMNKKLTHRGPDDEGEYSDDAIALGHRRLSIIDLSEKGRQPMVSGNGRYVLVFNGEIYNFSKIRSQLTDYPFQSATDTEVLLAAWQKWGSGCLEKLNGMFTFAIWDRVEKQLFLARDRLGIKPLYYYQEEGRFLFSSEIRALLGSGHVPGKINHTGLNDYLRYQTVHAPDTLVKDVKMLMAGEFAQFDGTTLHTKKYWDLSRVNHQKMVGSNYGEIKKDVNRLMLEAVEKRLVADVPFGAFLSGGIDSSIIVGLMSRLIPGKVNTFSVTFDEKSHDEAPYSRMVAAKFGTNHTEIRLAPDDFLETLPEAMEAMDHPSGDGPNTYIVSRVTKDAGVTMALSGLGGDELFAGYDIFRRSLKLERIRWLSGSPASLRSVFGSAIQNLKPGVPSAKLAALMNLDSWNFENSYPLSRQLFLEDAMQSILSNGYYRKHNRINEIIESGKFDRDRDNLLSRTSFAEISTYMQNVLLRDTDQMSMANSLEVRVPFLDHELVQYVMAVNDRMKYPKTPKKLLTDSFSGLIPEEIIHRKKMGFELPWDFWLRNELKDTTTFAFNQLAERPFINSDSLMELLKRYFSGDKRINWSRIWILVVLESWLAKMDIES